MYHQHAVPPAESNHFVAKGGTNYNSMSRGGDLHSATRSSSPGGGRYFLKRMARQAPSFVFPVKAQLTNSLLESFLRRSWE